MKLTFNAPFTIVYTFVSCFVFFILLENDLFENAFFLNGVTNFNNWEWYAGTLGYIAGHANFNHLAGNFMFILLLGPIVENHYGSKKLTLMVLLTALLTSVIHIIFWDHRIIGASGIVFMLIILAALIPSKGKEIPLTFLIIICLYIGKEIIGSFADDSVSQFAHITGGILGGIWGYKLKNH